VVVHLGCDVGHHAIRRPAVSKQVQIRIGESDLREVERALLLDDADLAVLWGVTLEAMRSCVRRHGGFWASFQMVTEWPSGKRYWLKADALRHRAAREWPNNRGTGEVAARRRAGARLDTIPRLVKARETTKAAGAAAAAAGAAEADCPYRHGWARPAWIEGWNSGTGPLRLDTRKVD
jgi:ribosome modulation factor